MLPTLHGLILK